MSAAKFCLFSIVFFGLGHFAASCRIVVSNNQVFWYTPHTHTYTAIATHCTALHLAQGEHTISLSLFFISILNELPPDECIVTVWFLRMSCHPSPQIVTTILCECFISSLPFSLSLPLCLVPCNLSVRCATRKVRRAIAIGHCRETQSVRFR